MNLELVFPLGLAESELLSLEQRTGEKGVLFSSTLHSTQLWAHIRYTFPGIHTGGHVAVHSRAHTYL